MGLFPRGHKRLAWRDPREEMEDTLCEMLCSVIPIQHNKNQTQRGHIAQLHLEPSTVQYQPQTLYSCYKNTAVQIHLALSQNNGT